MSTPVGASLLSGLGGGQPLSSAMCDNAAPLPVLEAAQHQTANSSASTSAAQLALMDRSRDSFSFTPQRKSRGGPLNSSSAVWPQHRPISPIGAIGVGVSEGTPQMSWRSPFATIDASYVAVERSGSPLGCRCHQMMGSPNASCSCGTRGPSLWPYGRRSVNEERRTDSAAHGVDGRGRAHSAAASANGVHAGQHIGIGPSGGFDNTTNHVGSASSYRFTLSDATAPKEGAPSALLPPSQYVSTPRLAMASVHAPAARAPSPNSPSSAAEGVTNDSMGEGFLRLAVTGEEGGLTLAGFGSFGVGGPTLRNSHSPSPSPASDSAGAGLVSAIGAHNGVGLGPASLQGSPLLSTARANRRGPRLRSLLAAHQPKSPSGARVVTPTTPSAALSAEGAGRSPNPKSTCGSTCTSNDLLMAVIAPTGGGDDIGRTSVGSHRGAGRLLMLSEANADSLSACAEGPSYFHSHSQAHSPLVSSAHARIGGPFPAGFAASCPAALASTSSIGCSAAMWQRAGLSATGSVGASPHTPSPPLVPHSLGTRLRQGGAGASTSAAGRGGTSNGRGAKRPIVGQWVSIVNEGCLDPTSEVCGSFSHRLGMGGIGNGALASPTGTGGGTAVRPLGSSLRGRLEGALAYSASRDGSVGGAFGRSISLGASGRHGGSDHNTSYNNANTYPPVAAYGVDGFDGDDGNAANDNDNDEPPPASIALAPALLPTKHRHVRATGGSFGEGRNGCVFGTPRGGGGGGPSLSGHEGGTTTNGISQSLGLSLSVGRSAAAISGDGFNADPAALLLSDCGGRQSLQAPRPSPRGGGIGVVMGDGRIRTSNPSPIPFAPRAASPFPAGARRPSDQARRGGPYSPLHPASGAGASPRSSSRGSSPQRPAVAPFHFTMSSNSHDGLLLGIGGGSGMHIPMLRSVTTNGTASSAVCSSSEAGPYGNTNGPYVYTNARSPQHGAQRLAAPRAVRRRRNARPLPLPMDGDGGLISSSGGSTCSSDVDSDSDAAVERGAPLQRTGAPMRSSFSTGASTASTCHPFTQRPSDESRSLDSSASAAEMCAGGGGSTSRHAQSAASPRSRCSRTPAPAAPNVGGGEGSAAVCITKSPLPATSNAHPKYTRASSPSSSPMSFSPAVGHFGAPPTGDEDGHGLLPASHFVPISITDDAATPPR